MKEGLAAYKQTDILGKSQLDLVIKVYDGAIDAYKAARKAYEEEDNDGGYEQLQKAKRFITHLYTTLNMDEGGAIAQLLEHPRVNTSLTPRSEGGAVAAKQQGGANGEHAGDPAHDTGDFGDGHLGNLRLDYALPSVNLEMLDARIFWPAPDSELAPLVTHSDHRMVWVDLQVF